MYMSMMVIYVTSDFKSDTGSGSICEELFSKHKETDQKVF